MTDQQGGVAAAQNVGLVARPEEIKRQIVEMFNQKREGFEEQMKPEDFIMPRAKLLQGLSPEVQADAKSFTAGMVINSITKTPLPKTFVPVTKWTNWVRFNPRDKNHPDFSKEFEPGDVVWRSADPDDPRVREQSQWRGENPPLATAFMNFLSYFEGVAMPVVLSFAKTSYGAGKTLLNLALHAGGPMFGHKYELGVQQQTNAMGTFYVFTVRPLGPCAVDEVEIGRAVHSAFGPWVRSLKVHEEDKEPGAEG